MIPERDAAERIGRALFKHLDAHGTFTDQFRREVGAKCVAHRAFLAQVFRELDANPHAIGHGDRLKRRQQTVNEVDDLTWWLETAAYHKHAWEEAVDMIDRLTARAVAEHDVDEREQDRENHRLREVAHDERASEQAPRFAS